MNEFQADMGVYKSVPNAKGISGNSGGFQ